MSYEDRERLSDSQARTRWRSKLYLFRGAVKGVVIRQVQVLPEELMVHLGSYGADVMGNRYG